MVFKHQTRKQFKSFFHGIRFCSLRKEVKRVREEVELLIFIQKNLSYKIRKDFSESDKHKEILSLEISYKNSSNILLSCCYQPSKGDNDILSMFLKQVFKKSAVEKKPYYLIGDLNMIA